MASRMRLTAVVVSAFALITAGGCAALGVRTEGTNGPFAWRITDLTVETREINGQPVDGRAFTLVVKNVSAETLTLTKMDEKRYQPGAAPGSSSYTGTWVLRPGAEWKIPRFYSLRCRYLSGCSDSTLAQPMFRIRFTGVDDQNRPLDATLDIT